MKRGGCGLLLVGFILGWGFAILTRPDSTPNYTSPSATYEQPSAPDRPHRVPETRAPPSAVTETPNPTADSNISSEGIAEPALPAEVDKTQAETAADLVEAQQQLGPSDANIRALLVERSIASYSGSCPCPYNVDRGGRRCGGRSAYARPGGASPLCYPSDVTDEQVQRFRSSQ